MKKHILALVPALALLLSGCAFLLERSYTVVEPYTNRYLDTAAEDALRAESYQDLVNSLLMLVEEHSTEGVIRYYGENDLTAYSLALAARREVLQETVLGSYLLQDLKLSFSGEDTYSSLAFTFTYREEAEDPEKLMVLSGTQSLVDLLRMSVREGHNMLTARFFEKTDRTDITAAVESLWQELQQGEREPDAPAEEQELLQPPIEDTVTQTAPADTPPVSTDLPAPPEGSTEGEGNAPLPIVGETPEKTTDDFPACPWTMRFYPDRSAAEIVEILLLEE